MSVMTSYVLRASQKYIDEMALRYELIMKGRADQCILPCLFTNEHMFCVFAPGMYVV